MFTTGGIFCSETRLINTAISGQYFRGFCSVSVRLRACPGDNIEYGQQQMHNDYLTGRTRAVWSFDLLPRHGGVTYHVREATRSRYPLSGTSISMHAASITWSDGSAAAVGRGPPGDSSSRDSSGSALTARTPGDRKM